MPALPRRLFAAISLLFAALAAPAADAPADLYGDPLPPGAFARMGTARLRQRATAVAFAPDGKTFATAGGDNFVRLWSVADGKEVRTFKGPATNFSGVAFSADGKKLYSSGYDGIVREWDPDSGKEVRSFGTKPVMSLQGLVVHPTEPLALTWDAGGAVREWDLKEGKETRNVANLRGWTVVLCPDGKHFAASQNNLVTLRDLTGKEVFRFQPPQQLGLRAAFSADGKTLAVGSSDLNVRVFDVESGKEIRTVPQVSGSFQTLALSPRGRYFVTRGGAQSVQLYGVASGKELRQFDLPPVYVSVVAFSPDEKKLVCCQAATIQLWDLETNRAMHEHPGHVTTIDAVRFSPDGKRLTTTGQGTAYWWDAATGKPLASWNNTLVTGYRAPIAPDGGSFYAGAAINLVRCEFNEGRPAERPWPREANGFNSCAALSADGKVMAVRARDLTVHFLAADGKELGRLPLEANRPPQLALSPDGRQFATGGFNVPVRLWDVGAGQETRQFSAGAKPGAASSVSGLEYSPDGRGLLTVFFEAAFWETATGRERWRVTRTPTTQLVSAAFSPDGRLVALGAVNGTVYVHETATGAELGKFAGHRGAVHSLHFAADGNRLASGGDDGTALVWDTAELSKKARPAAAKLDDARLADLWNDLGGGDTAKAYRAVRALADAPQQAAPFLQGKLKGGGGDLAERVGRLIADLDSDDFDTREKAHKELEGLGAAAAPEMRKALAAKPSTEVRARLERLLEPFKDKDAVPADRLREMRVLEALEYAGGAEAVEVLKKLAAGDAKAPLTQDAKATLERVTKRGPKP
jgi:WD40 repeat protein